jgi:hypothetical protein
MQDTVYHGGANIQYSTEDNDRIIRRGGWMARRWDTAVAHRFLQACFLFSAISFDGKIEGINLPETSQNLVKRESSSFGVYA